MKYFFYMMGIAIALTACNTNANNKNEQQHPITEEQKANALKDSANFTTAAWLDSTFKDVGKVKKGEIAEIPFTIKNTGDKPLIISSVQPGCGCTVGEKPEKPIMPGKEDKIVAKFNSTGQSNGSHLKSMVVKANTTPSTDQILNFKVEVVE